MVINKKNAPKKYHNKQNKTKNKIRPYYGVKVYTKIQKRIVTIIGKEGRSKRNRLRR